MGVLVEDLLLLARLDAQRPLERRRVDLLVLATDAVHDAHSIAPNRRVEIEVFDGPGTPEVLGDEARLRQVLGNLVSNALQHTPDTAGITVRVGTEDDEAKLEVIDEGPGMSEEDAHRVFERFYRTDSSRPRRVVAAASWSACRGLRTYPLTTSSTTSRLRSAERPPP
jgi:two-component system OmpR family sensor kinase